jgi:hypothetical protein
VLLGLGLAAILCACGPARVRRAALALAGASVLSLAAAESLARVFLARRFTSIYQLDRECLHTLVPGAEKLFVHRPANGGRLIPVSVDSQGYRGPELAPKGSRRRVVVFGDSCIEAEFSRVEDTFVERLGGELGSGVQMVNAGVIAYGPDQELVRMRRELPALEADLVIVALCADNDLGDMLRNKLFRLGEKGELSENRFTLAPRIRSQLELARKGFVLERALHRTLERLRTEQREASATSERTREADRVEEWLTRSKAEYEDYVVRGDNEVREIFEDHYDADVALEPDSPSALYKRALLAAVVGEMRRVAEASGARFLVVVIPARQDVCESFDLGWIDPERWSAWRRDALSGAMAEAALGAGAPCVELFEPFRAGGGCELYLHGGDSHWNERGQALAAELVAERIRREAWLE